MDPTIKTTSMIPSSTTKTSPPKIAILGAGITGLAAALSFHTYLPPATSTSPAPIITIYEARPSHTTNHDPSSPTSVLLGGAVNLTPNALRYLSHIGVLQIIRERGYGCDVDGIEIASSMSGYHVGTLNFNGPEGKGCGGFKALRIRRGQLSECLMEALEQVRKAGPNEGGDVGSSIVWDKKAACVREKDRDGKKKAIIEFADGTEAEYDLVLGCDGIHSVARSTLVDSSRKPEYSGIAVAYGFARWANESSDQEPPFFKTTGVATSRVGTFLASYCDPNREILYLGAVMELAEVSSREGWKTIGADQKAVKKDIMSRIGQSRLPLILKMIEATEEWFLYPVYRLPSGGNWCSEKTMLLGDAAHAMPPQGESVGYALEDVIIFARCLAATGINDLQRAFEAYERMRRKRINDAFRETSFRWETAKDTGWFAAKLKELLTPVFLWWTSSARTRGFEEDLAQADLGLEA